MTIGRRRRWQGSPWSISGGGGLGGSGYVGEGELWGFFSVELGLTFSTVLSRIRPRVFSSFTIT